MWAEWVVQGDAHYSPGTEARVESPLFTTVVEGGWFSKATYITSTKPGVDPALALLVAHLCYTEYSVAEIKADLRPNTPNLPPRSFFYQPPAQNQMVFSGSEYNAAAGAFNWAQ